MPDQVDLQGRKNPLFFSWMWMLLQCFTGSQLLILSSYLGSSLAPPAPHPHTPTPPSQSEPQSPPSPALQSLPTEEQN